MGETGQGDACTGTRRLVHLAKDQGATRTFGRAVMLFRVLVHAGFDHFPVQVVTFAGPLTDTGEDRVTTEQLGDIVDQFLDEDRLADAGAAEQADLAALGVGAQQIDDLDSGRQDFGFRGLLVE